jgi:hypothetical protein
MLWFSVVYRERNISQKLKLKIMKLSIKLMALLLLASASLFAKNPIKAKKSVVTTKITTKNMASFYPLFWHRGVEVKINKNLPGKAVVIVYDQDGNAMWKDVLPSETATKKGYVLNQLADGEYKIEVSSNKQTTKRYFHVWDEGKIKEVILRK